MEVGKLYKSVANGVVVKCIDSVIGFDGMFSGVVARDDSHFYENGYTASWSSDVFKEYTPTQALVNGYTYTIPDGCKATVKDGKVFVEVDEKYYKDSLRRADVYFRHTGGIKTVVTFRRGCLNYVSISRFEYSEITPCGKVIEKEEFIEAYNKALKDLEL